MGLHLVDIIIVAAIGLALFGSKTLQSMARGAGKTAGQAKSVKDKVMADIPLDEITRVTEHIPQVPLNSRQALQMLMRSDEKQTQKEAANTVERTEADHENKTNA